MKCVKCGYEMDNKDKYCPKCGNGVGTNDSGSSWYLILGLFLPLVATILYCIYSGSKPKTSKKLMIGFIIGYVIAMIRTVLLFFFFVIGGISSIEHITDCASKCEGSFSYTNGQCVCHDKTDRYNDFNNFDDFENNFFFD